MKPNTKSSVGKLLLVLGSVWFVLAFFWLPPLMLVFGWFHLPDLFYVVLLRSEFVVSAAMAATGVGLWRSASKNRPILAYAVAYVCAACAVLAVFLLYGFIPLARG